MFLDSEKSLPGRQQFPKRQLYIGNSGPGYFQKEPEGISDAQGMYANKFACAQGGESL